MNSLGSVLAQLSDKEVTLLVALAGAIGAVVVLLLQGAGFLIRRRLTGEGVHQHIARLSSLADLRAKMLAHGMTLQDIKELESSLTTGELSKVLDATVSFRSDEDEKLPQSYWTTYAMLQRASARLASLDAQLNEVLTDLETLLDEKQGAALEKTHRAWLVYRRQQMRYIASLYEGGTIAPLLAVAHAISLTERQVEHMHQEVLGRKNPVG